MRFSYDKQNDSLYLHFSERAGATVMEVSDGVVLDLDDSGSVVGLDIEHASRKVDLSTLDIVGLPTARSGD